MIEVSQRIKHIPGEQEGDCARACIASIFEVPYEETEAIDGYADSVYKWTRERYPGIRASSRSLIPYKKFWKMRPGDHVKWPREHRESGYWLATVWSERIADKEIYGCGCKEYSEDGDCEWCNGIPSSRYLHTAWGLHAVVMKGDKLAWDPHPDAKEDIELYFSDATTWHVFDPSKLRAV